MLRVLLVILCAMTCAACTWPFAEKKHSVGTDFEFQDFSPADHDDNPGDGSIAWVK